MKSLELQYQIMKLQEQINLVEKENRELSDLIEKKMTPAEEKEASRLHKKVSKSGFIEQYGKEKGEKVYYATMQKQAMKKA
jgi:hypothetical protein